MRRSGAPISTLAEISGRRGRVLTTCVTGDIAAPRMRRSALAGPSSAAAAWLACGAAPGHLNWHRSIRAHLYCTRLQACANPMVRAADLRRRPRGRPAPAQRGLAKRQCAYSRLLVGDQQVVMLGGAAFAAGPCHTGVVRSAAVVGPWRSLAGARAHDHCRRLRRNGIEGPQSRPARHAMGVGSPIACGAGATTRSPEQATHSSMHRGSRCATVGEAGNRRLLRRRSMVHVRALRLARSLTRERPPARGSLDCLIAHRRRANRSTCAGRTRPLWPVPPCGNSSGFRAPFARRSSPRPAVAVSSRWPPTPAQVRTGAPAVRTRSTEAQGRLKIRGSAAIGRETCLVRRWAPRVTASNLRTDCAVTRADGYQATRTDRACSTWPAGRNDRSGACASRRSIAGRTRPSCTPAWRLRQRGCPASQIERARRCPATRSPGGPVRYC